MNYFDPKVLAGVKKLSLRARVVVDGVMVGVHTSHAKGLSSEFEEHRGYTHGDDTRHIDWLHSLNCVFRQPFQITPHKSFRPCSRQRTL